MSRVEISDGDTTESSTGTDDDSNYEKEIPPPFEVFQPPLPPPPPKKAKAPPKKKNPPSSAPPEVEKNSIRGPPPTAIPDKFPLVGFTVFPQLLKLCNEQPPLLKPRKRVRVKKAPVSLLPPNLGKEPEPEIKKEEEVEEVKEVVEKEVDPSRPETGADGSVTIKELEALFTYFGVPESFELPPEQLRVSRSLQGATKPWMKQQFNLTTQMTLNINTYSRCAHVIFTILLMVMTGDPKKFRDPKKLAPLSENWNELIEETTIPYDDLESQVVPKPPLWITVNKRAVRLQRSPLSHTRRLLEVYQMCKRIEREREEMFSKLETGMPYSQDDLVGSVIKEEEEEDNGGGRDTPTKNPKKREREEGEEDEEVLQEGGGGARNFKKPRPISEHAPATDSLTSDKKD